MYIHSSSTKEEDGKELVDSMYYPLYRYLVQEFGNTTNKRITLSFSKIDQILGGLLPQKAWIDSAWWAKDETYVHAKAWTYAGWYPETPNIHPTQITFVRQHPPFESLIRNALLLKHRYKDRSHRLDACMPV